jgi:Domain of unknown function (DUF4124)
MRRHLLSLAAVSVCFAGAAGAAPMAGQVFTCVDAGGRTLTSDRLIAACMDREQRILARDGTLLRIVPAQLTADERAEKEAKDRRAAAEREAKAEAVRRDRSLVQRYPNEATHRSAREAALESVRASILISENRLKELAAERKPLAEEAEFYKGKPLPFKLKQQIDANEASTQAQRDAQANQKAEMERVTKGFDGELARLKRLWAGAAPGSLGPGLEDAAVPGAPVKAVAANGATVKPAPKK